MKKTVAKKTPKTLSKVEQFFLSKSSYEFIYSPTEKIPIIQVGNFPVLGKMTALRFIEWVQQNSGGVISLPTGKTPEHFISWVSHYIKTWDNAETAKELQSYGIDSSIRPDMRSLHFVQIDEFYPIDPYQHNSFFYYINKYYFKNLDLDPAKALMINTHEIGTAEGLALDEIFICPSGSPTSVGIPTRLEMTSAIPGILAQPPHTRIMSGCSLPPPDAR